MVNIRKLEEALFQRDKAKIQWLVHVVGFKRETMSLGFCERHPKRVAFIVPDEGLPGLAPLIVRNLYITKQECEEGQRCLVLECPLNRTTYTSYIQSAAWKKKNLPKKQNFVNLLKMVKKIEGWLKQDIAKIDWQHDAILLYKGPTLVLHRSPKK